MVFDSVHVLKNSHGIEVHVLSIGGVIQRLFVPDRNGSSDDVVLGFDDTTNYSEPANPYFGAVVGRFANRIAGAAFTIDGKKFTVDANEKRNCLHGGKDGWHLKEWKTAEGAGHHSLRLHLHSPDGDMGFPGSVDATVTYRLTEDNILHIDFEATTDAATPINMAQHSYFNLDGASSGNSILDHQITINASHYTPVGEGLIPTGEVAPVEGTAFDLRELKRVGDRVRELASGPGPSLPGGFDHNFVLFGNDGPAAKAKTHHGSVWPVPKQAITLYSPATGRALDISTTAPGVQFYSGGGLDGVIKGKGDVFYNKFGGLALETQVFPDAPNQPSFPDSILTPGSTYRHNSAWRFYIRD
eukprot:jgi/Botrbrau1/15298/Bobra.0096s0001.1